MLAASAAPLAGHTSIANSAYAHALLDQNLDRVKGWTAELNARKGVSDADWDEWSTFQRSVLQEIEDLPASAENVLIKTKAIMMIYENDLSDMETETTDIRLVRHVLLGLSA